MSRKKTILMGTFILTLTGILSRCIGFGQRMFLSQTFGAEGLGMYQLIFPVYGLCLALTTGGIQTSISRTVAARVAVDDSEGSKSFLLCSMLLSVSISVVVSFLLYSNANFIANQLLGDSRTYDLLLILAYAFPFSSIHGCIMGYYLGKKQTAIPSICQLLEQIIRVGSIYCMYALCLKNNVSYNISLAVVGLVFAEIISALFSLLCISSSQIQISKVKLTPNLISQNIQTLLPMAVPLTSTRVVLSILHSIEAVSIPSQLRNFGLSNTDALSTYGILVGMALPCILFPTAITSAISTMLLPTVSEIQALNNKKEIKLIVHKTMQYCTLLGFTCLISFLLFSDIIGELLFHNTAVSSYLRVMAWLCPFLYLNTTLLSILNGLGKATTTFLLNTSSLLIRIACVFYLIPNVGIYGYLSGLLFSQIFVTVGCMLIFRRLCLI